jgi:hypothetical protein
MTLKQIGGAKMLAKYFRLTTLLIVCLSYLIVTNVNAADKLYYGSYDGEEFASALKDSLNFNIVRADQSDLSEIQLLAENGMRAIVANFGDSTPLSWSCNSHYTLWEAEGFPGSNVNLEYDGGSLVYDDSASGGEAMKFTGPGTPRLIQWGPTSLYCQEYDIQYTAEFRLKFPYSDSTEPVCSIMVVDTHKDTILKDSTLRRCDFPIAGGYKTFKLENYSMQEFNEIQFQIYWFGVADTLYIDYVKAHDAYGDSLMTGSKDSAITAYVSQDWTKTMNVEGDTVIYPWYGRDEPPPIDPYMPYVHIDSLLKRVSQERVLFQAFNWIWRPDIVHEYLLRENPKDFCIDIFPMGELGHDTTGSNYQEKWNTQIQYLSRAKTVADSTNKDFWLVPQVYTYADTFKGSCRLLPANLLE